ncbi:hypothetical protein LCGC14_0532370 [marine sediment metagenome]|uniref:Uncharacterized protein n=1 Tax=marine sediment metagenome TaxID=412755 RepID=A0A0F9V3F0_9ZZZZ
MKPLWRTTIHIWTEDDPQKAELETLAYEATEGSAFCSKQDSEYIRDPIAAGLQTEFFDGPDDEV